MTGELSSKPGRLVVEGCRPLSGQWTSWMHQSTLMIDDSNSCVPHLNTTECLPTKALGIMACFLGLFFPSSRHWISSGASVLMYLPSFWRVSDIRRPSEVPDVLTFPPLMLLKSIDYLLNPDAVSQPKINPMINASKKSMPTPCAGDTCHRAVFCRNPVMLSFSAWLPCVLQFVWRRTHTLVSLGIRPGHSRTTQLAARPMRHVLD